MPLIRGWDMYHHISGFSAPKGVERACPLSWIRLSLIQIDCFSAPKGVERACPPPEVQGRLFPYTVSVPRRALRGHAPQPRRGGMPHFHVFQCPEGR